MIETEILVVGGGPAGTTTAKYLSLAGIKNILIQRNFHFKKPCGGGVRLDAFDTFEIDKNLIEKEVYTLNLVHKKQKISIDITQTPIAIVDRVKFDTALRKQAKEAGTDVYEATFVNLEIFENYVISTIKKEDTFIKIKSKYVVAADGVNSKLRKQVNKENVSATMTHYCDITSQQYTSCTFHVGAQVAQKNYAWAFPHAEGSNIGVVGESQCLSVLKKDLLLEEKTKDLGYKIPNYDNMIFYKTRVFFVGDSASQVLPFTYEGIYYAMGAAKILSNVLINKEPPSAYEKQWKEKYAKKFDTLLKLQKLFLYNDFTIRIMMQLYKSQYIQKQMVLMWLGDRELTINAAFALKVIKRIIQRRK